jgi:hypothetical protein
MIKWHHTAYRGIAMTGLPNHHAALIRTGLAAVLIVNVITGCRTTGDSKLKTDLGATGNKQVVEQVQRYKKKTAHCDATGSGTRILMTGFGLFSNPPKNFQGTPYNISGLVARFMADPAVFPAQISTATSQVAPLLRNRAYARYSHMPANADGAHISQREMTIDQKPVTVCFVLLDVIWDQAAAVILFEASKFKPDRIIMSGLNSGEKKDGMFEAGAVNNATDYGGFNADGAQNPNNIPIENAAGESPVLPKSDPGVEQSIAMTWDAKALAALTLPIAKKIPGSAWGQSFAVRGEDAARPSNDYICNNVSFVILHAIKGTTVNLAGGKLRIGPASSAPAAGEDVEFIELETATAGKVSSAGFFHYPDTRSDRGSTVFGWGLVIAKAMVAGL